MNSDPNILYYNLSIANTNNAIPGQTYGQNAAPTIAAVNALNTETIVDNPSDWYCSIIRFSIPLFDCPLIQFLVKTDANNIVQDINQGIYSFTLQGMDDNGNVITSPQSFFQYIQAQTFSVANPPPVGTVGQTFSSYYFMYDYTQWIDMMNASLITALANLKSLPNTTNISGAPVPFFIYEPYSQLISCYANSDYYNFVNNPGGHKIIKIFFNSALEIYMSGFRYLGGAYGLPLGLDNQLYVADYNGTNSANVGGTDYLVMTQQYSNLGYWSFLKGIVIGTSMNINYESTYINFTQMNEQSTGYVNILTDFLPDLSTIGQQAGISNKIQIYNAPSLFRVFEFNQINPLTNITANIYLVDKYNNIYPLLLNKGLEANIKFMFIKKSAFKMNQLNQNSDNITQFTGFGKLKF